MIIQKMLIRVFIYKARQLHLFCDVQVFVTLRNVCMYPLLLLRIPDDVKRGNIERLMCYIFPIGTNQKRTADPNSLKKRQW